VRHGDGEAANKVGIGPLAACQRGWNAASTAASTGGRAGVTPRLSETPQQDFCKVLEARRLFWLPRAPDQHAQNFNIGLFVHTMPLSWRSPLLIHLPQAGLGIRGGSDIGPGCLLS
jgi:hypothetical protein